MNIKTIYAEITNRCNLNCHTCYNRSGRNHVTAELSARQLEDIIRQFLPYGLERFLLSGGEPTLHSQFDSILKLVDRYPQISFGIVTNGTTACQKLSEYLNTRRNLSVQISLDGSCEAVNARVRGKNHFGKAVSFVKSLHTPANKPLLKMVISQQNFSDIENFYRLALTLNCVPEFAFIYKSGNASDNWTDKSLTAQQKLKALKLITRLNQETGTNAVLPLCTNSCSYVSGLNDLSLCVKVDGSIQPCQALYDDSFSIGNAFRFDAIDFTDKLRQLNRLAIARSHTDYGCQRCLLQNGCGRGCMAAAVYINGDPLSNDGDCEYRKLQFLAFLR